MKNTLKTGWCKILVVGGEEWVGNIRVVGVNESVVEVPRWDGNAETIETYDIPNEFLIQEVA
jgi:hypothetical protein